MRRFILLTIGLLFAAAHASAASFDCKNANTNVEKLVCANEELSKLDEQLAQSFQVAIEVREDKTYTTAHQKWWIREKRNPCRSVSCLPVEYEDRIMELDVSNARPVSGRRGLIMGSWGAVALVFENDVLFAGEKFLTYRSAPVDDNCVRIPYSIIVEREGHGPGSGIPYDKRERSSEITIELRPDYEEQARGCKARVFDFTIPDDMAQHADICVANSLEALKIGHYSWGGYGKR